MTAVAAVQWRKEFRELLPWWSAILATVIVCWALMPTDLTPAEGAPTVFWLYHRNLLLFIGVCAHGAGAVTLGALAIGNEYSHATLSQLLVHPTARGQILRVKLTVLALMLAVLGIAAFSTGAAAPVLVGLAGELGRVKLIVLPLVYGLLLAPWLTMVARGPLGGAIFTAVMPCLLWMGGGLVGLPSRWLWINTVVLAVAGAVMTWRTFLRLEAAETHQAHVDLTRWFNRSKAIAAPSRAQNRLWLLVAKELRLQQATFMVGALYLAVWVIVVVGRRFSPSVFADSQLYAATFLTMVLVPLFAGALASAEERRLGVADWHTLLPVAAWKQWAIKAGVAMGTALALGVVLPMVLATIETVPSGFRDGIEPLTSMILCLTALYISTLSTNGLRALLATGPVLALGLAATLFLDIVLRIAGPVLERLARAAPVVEIPMGAYPWWMRVGPEWGAVGLGLLLLWFGHVNHRTSDRSRGRLTRQFGWIVTYFVGSLVTFSFVNQLVWHWILTARALGK